MERDFKKLSELTRDLGFNVEYYPEEDNKYNPSGSKSFCAITTLAKLTDRNWEDVYRELTEIGIKNRIEAVEESNIISFLDINCKYKIRKVSNIALYFLKNEKYKDKKYVIMKSGHMFLMDKNIIYDFKYNNIDLNMCSEGSIIEIIDNEKDIKDKNSAGSIINYLPIKDRFKRYNPRMDKSNVNNRSFGDSIVRALCKTDNQKYHVVHLKLGYFELINETLFDYAAIRAMLEMNYHYNQILDDDDELYSFYNFMKEYTKGKYIIVLDISKFSYQSKLYLPVIDGIVYYNDLIALGYLLNSTVIEIYKKDEEES